MYSGRCGHKGYFLLSLWACKQLVVVVVVIRGIARDHCGHLKKLLIVVVVIRGIACDHCGHVKSL